MPASMSKQYMFRVVRSVILKRGMHAFQGLSRLRATDCCWHA